MIKAKFLTLCDLVLTCYPLWFSYHSCRFVGSLGTIIIKCKDFRIIQLDIPGMEECLNIASSIEVSVLQAKI